MASSLGDRALGAASVQAHRSGRLSRGYHREAIDQHVLNPVKGMLENKRLGPRVTMTCSITLV